MRHPLDCVLLAVACLLITGSAHAADSARPHVLFLAVDDMKDWIGCLGGYPGTVHTPHLDALARRGTLFTNAHCASPKCAPSRAALLTGLRPSTTGLYDNSHWWFPNFPDVKTLPAHFRDHGYRAVGAGKIFHHTAGNHPPNQWDAFQPMRFRADPWFRGSRQNYPWSRHTPFPAGFPFSGVKGLGHENDWGALPIEEHDYDDAQTVAYALEQVQQTAQTSDPQPLFLACGIFRPHLPWYVPQTYFDLYPLDSIQLPRVHPNDLDDVPDAGRKFAEARAEDARTIQSAGKWREAVQAYLASISYADAQLGKLLEALYASSLVKNTIIVLWSDHGWHLGEKGHWHKSTLWEEATRVPLIIVVPGAAPGVCRQPVSLLDIFPTLIDLCQLSPLASLDGHSLAPLVKAPQQNWPYPAVTEFRSGNAAVRSDRFRLIRYQDGSEELYDHQTDPEEWHNLASQQSHATVRAELARWLPTQWAAPAATKKAFTFDPDRFEWTHRESGAVIRGRE